MGQEQRDGSSLVDFAALGEVGKLTATRDWTDSSVGAIARWPQSLRIVLRIVLSSRYAMWLGWGPELTFFYNDAYAQMTLGRKHPWALGRSVREVWSEIWGDIAPRADSVLESGVATWDEGLMLLLERSDFPEETYHTFSYSPVPDDAGRVGGLLCVVTEETDRVIGERRLALLAELAAELTSTQLEEDVVAGIGRRVTGSKDLPFAAVYLFDEDGRHARLGTASGVAPGSAAAPLLIDVEHGGPWPWDGSGIVMVDDLATRFPSLPKGPWDRPARQAVIAPIAKPGQDRPAGFLVAGLNPYRAFDAAYRGFVEIVAGQIAAGVANARAYAEERKRAEALAELDRAKTTFFSNVSHEFRTPLTLMLGPVEELLAKEATLAPDDRSQLELMHRNGQRLLKLVNNLLDFSRIEAGRIEASYQATDLAAFTADLASVFRSAVERAGLRLLIFCDPLPEPAYVDRDMWEKIVLNLVSNAFKYTLEGHIRVGLRERDGDIELSVSDTGIGIPPSEIAKLFNRFHRVEGARGRTHEGTGIGLALVNELVKLHGGSVGVSSIEGEGSTFTVAIPKGSAHLPAERVGRERTPVSTGGVNAFVEEALRWLPEVSPLSVAGAAVGEGYGGEGAEGERPRIVLADDNADMRDYVRRLLGERYQVLAVADGEAALETARAERPALVLTDVMMPKLDGFSLLRALRADHRTAAIPVIMLSARAGEEARVEGLGAGADDYLIKPFSARELMARVAGTLALARARRDAVRREEELRAETVSVLESIAEGFVALDREYRVIYMNTAAERQTGTTREAVLGRTHWEGFPTVVGTRVESELRRTMGERLPVSFELVDEASRRWYEIDMYPSREGGVAVYSRDVTERKRNTQQLQALAAAAVEVNALIGIDELVALVTDRARELVGARSVTTVLAADSASPGTQARAASSSSPKVATPAVPAESGLNGVVVGTARPLRLSRGEMNGDARWAELASAHRPPPKGYLGAPLVDRESNVLGVISATDKIDGDFTAGDEAILVQLAQTASVAMTNAQLFRAAQEARSQAEAANRMKDQFLATLSHELRTPLNAILGWARILQSGKAEGTTLKEGLETIERNSRVQAQLIEDLLDISRIISGKLRLDVHRVNLVDVIEAAVAAVRPAADAKQIRLHAVLDGQAGPVSGDSARLQQVVWNLLANAVKFTPRGGRVQVLLERKNSHVEITVADSGIGIRPEFIPFVFDRFRQADSSTTRQHGGLGLGLSIVRQLVELHGGTARVQSQGEGKGAIFTVSLPIVVAQAEVSGRVTPKPPTTAEMRVAPAPLDGLKVLVVDDEEDARELIHRILDDAKAHVVTAGSVADAMAALDVFTPDVLLSDIGMPEHDGYELIRRVRERGLTSRALPAVALTAFARPEDRRRALLAGFQIHVPKPVEPEELVAVVATLVGRTGAVS